MNKRNALYLLGLFLLVFSSCTSKISGPLKVSSANPRYFENAQKQVIYLTGSHTWNNFKDFSYQHDRPPFDFPTYLKFLKNHDHNFIRLWTWDLLNWETEGMEHPDYNAFRIGPFAWERTGPGLAADGLPKFDLLRFEEAYFDRLERRVRQARRQGIFVSVMLFEGYGTQFTRDGYRHHPFYESNNINHLGLDTAYSQRLTIYELKNEKALHIQKNYVRKVLERLDKYDNVLYEISNENHSGSTDWQYHFIRFIKENDRHRHPVGMTFQFKGGSNETLFNSPADWISPNEAGGYKIAPPAGNGQKVIVSDTDHLWGIGGNVDWVWKSFLSGINVIYMDPYQQTVARGQYDEQEIEVVRKNMGYTRRFSQKIDLKRAVPTPDLSSSGYCLSAENRQFIFYFPDNGAHWIDLSGTDADQEYEASWFDIQRGAFGRTEKIRGGSRQTVYKPTEDAKVLLLVMD